jgi:hypothetical protein
MIKTIKKFRQQDWIKDNINSSFLDYCISIRIHYIIPIVLLGILTIFNVYYIQAQTNSNINTFKDSKTKISLQYPSDWHVASKEYIDYLFGSLPGSTNSLFDKSRHSVDRPIVMLIPDSLSGSTVSIFSQTLPFHTSLKNSFESFKQALLLDPLAQISDAIPVSINGLNGFRYNFTYNGDPSFTQTQIFFVKGAKAYFILSQLGLTSIDEIKEKGDLDFIINSFKF